MGDGIGDGISEWIMALELVLNELVVLLVEVHLSPQECIPINQIHYKESQRKYNA